MLCGFRILSEQIGFNDSDELLCVMKLFLDLFFRNQVKIVVVAALTDLHQRLDDGRQFFRQKAGFDVFPAEFRNNPGMLLGIEALQSQYCPNSGKHRIIGAVRHRLVIAQLQDFLRKGQAFPGDLQPRFGQVDCISDGKGNTLLPDILIERHRVEILFECVGILEGYGDDDIILQPQIAGSL